MPEKRVYLDDDHNLVDPKNAVWLVIHKYDDKGELVEEAWVDLRETEPA